jgi:hypothetical protein
MLQLCRLTVGELRKLVTKARKQNHLTGPASKEQLLALFEAHADMDESVAQVLEGPVRVPMLRAQRVMLKDMYHPKVSGMNRASLLRYIYSCASDMNWRFPNMNDYEHRKRVGKAWRNSKPIGRSNKPPAGILPKRDRPKRALTVHQKFMSIQMKSADLREDYPDAKERFVAATALWNEEKGGIAKRSRALVGRRRARAADEVEAADRREERETTRRKAATKRARELKQHKARNATVAAQRAAPSRAAIKRVGKIPKKKRNDDDDDDDDLALDIDAPARASRSSASRRVGGQTRRFLD